MDSTGHRISQFALALSAEDVLPLYQIGHSAPVMETSRRRDDELRLQRDKMRRFTLVKSGLFPGGASMSDVNFCARVTERGLGDARIVAGVVHPFVEQHLKSLGVSYEIDTRLDREVQVEKRELLEKVVSQSSANDGVVLISQPFCSGRQLAEAVVSVSGRHRLVLRHHNPFVEHEDLYGEVPSAAGLPIQALISARCQAVNNQVRNVDLCPTVTDGAPRLSPQAAAELRSAVRRHLAASPRDILLVQSTRIVLGKGVDITLALAATLRRSLSRTDRRRVKILFAGRCDDPGIQSQLRALGQRHGFACSDLLFCHGDLSALGVKNFYQLDLACDMMVAPSRRDSFGMSIAEACLAGKPFVTTRFGDEVTGDAYAHVYERAGVAGLVLGAADEVTTSDIERAGVEMMSTLELDGWAKFAEQNRRIVESSMVDNFEGRLGDVLKVHDSL